MLQACSSLNAINAIDMTLCDFMADPYNAKYKIGFEECLLRQVVLNSHTDIYSDIRHNLFCNNLQDISDSMDIAFAIRHEHATPLRCELTYGRVSLHSFIAHPSAIEWILNGTPLPITAFFVDVRAKLDLSFYEVDTGLKVDIVFTLFGMMLNREIRRIVKTHMIICRISDTTYIDFWKNGVNMVDIEPGLSRSCESFLYKSPLYVGQNHI